MVLCQEWEAVGWSLWEEQIPSLLQDTHGATMSRTPHPH